MFSCFAFDSTPSYWRAMIRAAQIKAFWAFISRIQSFLRVTRCHPIVVAKLKPMCIYCNALQKWDYG